MMVLMPKVLIVDDAAVMRMKLKIILEKNGFEVSGEAENGIIAIEKYKSTQPDIVTMDITMPKMSGLEALKEIKKIDVNANVVMVSAMGQESIVKEAILGGAKTFIVKPFKEDHVIMTLNKILGVAQT